MKSEDLEKGAGKAGGDDSKSRQSFEQALERLESIVDRMEAGELSLEESINAYEEGVQIAGFCSGKLDEAERRVEILAKQADGKSTAAPFPFESGADGTLDQAAEEGEE